MGHYLSEMLFPEPLHEELHVITVKRHWGVFKRHSARSLRNFKHRDLAFLYAVRYAKNRDVQIIVHDTDGCVDFTYFNLKDKK